MDGCGGFGRIAAAPGGPLLRGPVQQRIVPYRRSGRKRAPATAFAQDLDRGQDVGLRRLRGLRSLRGQRGQCGRESADEDPKAPQRPWRIANHGPAPARPLSDQREINQSNARAPRRMTHFRGIRSQFSKESPRGSWSRAAQGIGSVHPDHRQVLRVVQTREIGAPLAPCAEPRRASRIASVVSP